MTYPGTSVHTHVSSHTNIPLKPPSGLPLLSLGLFMWLLGTGNKNNVAAFHKVCNGSLMDLSN